MMLLVPNYSVPKCEESQFCGNPDQVKFVEELLASGLHIQIATFAWGVERPTQVPFSDSAKLHFYVLGDWPAGLGPIGKVRRYVVAIFRLWKVVRSSDVIYAFLPGYNGLFAAFAASVSGKTLGLYVRGGLNHAGRLGKSLYLWVANRAHFILCTGVELRKQLRETGTKADLVAPMMAFAPSHIRSPAKIRSNTRCRVIFVGTLTRAKGIFQVLEAVKCAAESGLPVELRILGATHPDFEHEFLAKVASYRETLTVQYSGFVADPMTLATHYQWADILAFPSQSNEGFPRVIYEAMLAGCAVVTYDLPVFRGFLVNGRNSVLVRQGDRAAYTRALIRLCKEIDFRSQISANAMSDVNVLLNETSGMTHASQVLYRINQALKRTF